jgi:hypothetical protein
MGGRVPGPLEAEVDVSSLRFMEGQRSWTAAHWVISSMRPGIVARLPDGDGAGCRHRRDQHPIALGKSLVSRLTKFASLLLSVTAINLSVTQGLWLIPQDPLCSFQAVILHKTLHRFFRGRDSMKCNLEGHRSLFLQYPTCLPRSVLLKRHLDSTD